MVYQKTNFSVLPCSCFFCPHLMETTVTQGGGYLRSWYTCEIWMDEAPFILSDNIEFNPVAARHPDCPLAEF